MTIRLTSALLASAGAACAFLGAAYAVNQTDPRAQRVAPAQTARPDVAERAVAVRPVQTAKPPELSIAQYQGKEVALTPDSVYDFLVWAATSPRDQKEQVRAAIARVQGDDKVGEAIRNAYPKILADDFDFALVTLSVLGELRAPSSLPFFKEVISQAYPRERTAADPGLTRRESIELLQAKAVQGAAYLKSPDGDALTLETARSHPSRAVRSAAIEAYLYNAKDPYKARLELEGVLAPADLILLDTVSKGAMRSPEDFNKRLADFYAQHPEQIAAAPGEPKGPEVPDRLTPAKDENRTPADKTRKPR